MIAVCRGSRQRAVFSVVVGACASDGATLIGNCRNGDGVAVEFKDGLVG